MEGYDEEFIAVAPGSVWLKVFAESLQSLWPYMVISVEGFDVPAEEAQWVEDLKVLDRLDPGLGHAWFARDRAMVDRFEELSYTPMDDGQGVVAVLYSPPDHTVLSLDVPEAMQQTGVLRGAYTATLFLPSSAIGGSLITPAPVSGGGFSAGVWELLAGALADNTGS